MSFLSESQRTVVDRISTVVPDVEARMMLGTVGLYSDDEQFGILDGEDIYLRASDEHRETFEEKGATPYNSSGVAHAAYFRVPSDVLDDGDALQVWLAYAIEEAAHEDGERRQTR